MKDDLLETIKTTIEDFQKQRTLVKELELQCEKEATALKVIKRDLISRLTVYNLSNKLFVRGINVIISNDILIEFNYNEIDGGIADHSVRVLKIKTPDVIKLD